MTPHEMEILLKNIDARATRIEQILPTLATREVLAALAARMDGLATKEEIAKLATRAELREGLAEVRRHALILHEQVRSDIQLLAEHIAGLGRS